jgi:group II intron reverse transcriptase/maturase
MNNIFKERSWSTLDTNLKMDRSFALKAKGKVRDFQRKIYQKAKQEKKFRFYRLYDKICSLYFLHEAYQRVKAKGGSPGIDKVTFESIQKSGLEIFLTELKRELEEKKYRPGFVKRVYIPKANGSQRPLGIPNIRDRVIQMSCKLVIEPIFEADFDESSYGFRPKRNASQAVAQIKGNLSEGKTAVLDADLSNYFDTIPHSKLLSVVSIRISDNDVIHLIKKWLKSPVIEDGKINGGKKNKRGTPQGGVISPLLANIYLNLVDRLVRNKIEFRGIDIVRYADDFVLMGKEIGKESLDYLRSILDRMGLSLNSDKTELIDFNERCFDFLGFTFHRRRSNYDKRETYISVHPSKKSFQKLVQTIRTNLVEYRTRNDVDTVQMLNYKLRGWLNYFTIPKVSYTGITRRRLSIYLKDRLYRHQKRKSQRFNYYFCRSTYRRWIEKVGLIDPGKYGIATSANTRDEVHRKAVCGKIARTV